MYLLYKMPVDAHDDPPNCGIELRRFDDVDIAIRDAERTMSQDNDPDSSYFVIHSDTHQHIYSTGYVRLD